MGREYYASSLLASALRRGAGISRGDTPYACHCARRAYRQPPPGHIGMRQRWSPRGWRDAVGNAQACFGTTAFSGSSGSSTAAPSPLERTFAELRGLRPPCDAAQLAQLAQDAAEAASHGYVSARHAAGLVYRFGELEWYSTVLCEAFHSQAARAVDVVTPPEWLAMLHYFTGCGYYNEQLCRAVAEWALTHAQELQLHHLEVLVTSLAHFGHIDDKLGERLANTLEPLPPDADRDRLIHIAAGLAIAGVERPRLFHQVLRLLTARWKSSGSLLAGAEVQRASNLMLLAKAEAAQPGLVHSLVRQVNPEVVRAAMPLSLVPQLMRQLHRAALRKEALLLDARPLVGRLAVAAAELASSRRAAPAVLASLASGIGFFGIDNPRAGEALWQAGVAADDGRTWHSAVDSADPDHLRDFGQLAWGACVLALESLAGHAAASRESVWRGPSCTQMAALLRAAQPDLPGVKRIAQQLRQVALVLEATPNHGSALSVAVEQDKAAAATWLSDIPRAPLFSRQRRAQVRLMRAFVARLKEGGATVERIDGRRPKSAFDVISVAFADAQAKPVRVALWAKHPLLLAAAEEEPAASAGGSATADGCCLSGFEALELRCGSPGTAARLLLINSDGDSDDARSLADSILEDLAKGQLLPRVVVQ